MKELLRVDLREKYRKTLFADWEGRDLPAQHRFMPAEDGILRMGFYRARMKGTMVLDSADLGATWYGSDWGDCPPMDRGFYQGRRVSVSLARGGLDCWIQADGIPGWTRVDVPHADETQLDGIGAPNCFSAIQLTRGLYAGRIIMVSDYFLGQEGPDGELLGATYTDDYGLSWGHSKLFGVPEPLQPTPEGFGEPSVVELPSGWLWMVFRSLYGELWQSISHDGGTTWGRPSPTGFVAPIANCYAAREPTTGATVLCWNATQPGIIEDFRVRRSLYRPRTNLVFAVSHDNTRTWTEPVVVEAEGGQYPTIHFDEGRMFVMYQSSPVDKPVAWSDMGLTLTAYDVEEVLNLPAMTPETIRPWIDAGLIRHWRSVACTLPSRKTIS